MATQVLIEMPGEAHPLAPPLGFRYRMEGRFTEVVPIGMVPEGFRVDAHYTGTVVEGPLAGASVHGVDRVLVRRDGISRQDGHEVITTPAGEVIAIHGTGYGAAAGIPDPTLLASRPIEWPDRPSGFLGMAFPQTGSAEHAWMNRCILAYSGVANLGTGTLRLSARVLTREMCEPEE
jgi:hypothetical protein